MSLSPSAVPAAVNTTLPPVTVSSSVNAAAAVIVPSLVTSTVAPEISTSPPITVSPSTSSLIVPASIVPETDAAVPALIVTFSEAKTLPESETVAAPAVAVNSTSPPFAVIVPLTVTSFAAVAITSPSDAVTVPLIIMSFSVDSRDTPSFPPTPLRRPFSTVISFFAVNSATPPAIIAPATVMAPSVDPSVTSVFAPTAPFTVISFTAAKVVLPLTALMLPSTVRLSPATILASPSVAVTDLSSFTVRFSAASIATFFAFTSPMEVVPALFLNVAAPFSAVSETSP